MASYTPSTNNTSEAYNSVIKRFETFRQRLTFSEFVKLLCEMTNGVSRSFGTGIREIAKQRNISIQQWRNASAFAIHKENRPGYRKFETEDEVCFYVSSQKYIDNELDTNLRHCSFVVNKWNYKTFEEYVNDGCNMVYVVTIYKNELREKSLCTCQQFLKDFVCKHILPHGVVN